MGWPALGGHVRVVRFSTGLKTLHDGEQGTAVVLRYL
jgi:hypothetical protein